MPKTFATMSIRIAFYRKLCRRFFKFFRQFKFGLRCLGGVQLTELALAANAVLLTAYRLRFLS